MAECKQRRPWQPASIVAARDRPARPRQVWTRRGMRRRGEERALLVAGARRIYIIFLLLPIYWLVNMSFKTNQEILGGFSLWPQNPTLRNYAVIFTDPSWYKGYINSIIYVVHEHGDLDRRGAACGLCLLALPLPRRQAPVLLAAHQPHGAARRSSRCRSSSSIRPSA